VLGSISWELSMSIASMMVGAISVVAMGAISMMVMMPELIEFCIRDGRIAREFDLRILVEWFI
jgi:hypothetical protein